MYIECNTGVGSKAFILHSRLLSPPVPSREYDPTAVHDIMPFLKVIHGHSREADRKEMASITLSARLQKILIIARKL
jgi:hypothetical protein